jgi:integrase
MTARGYGSGSLRERRPGVWQLRVGGRTTTFRGTSKEANQALAKLVAGHGGRAATGTTVKLSALVDEWLGAARLEKGTVDTYRTALAHLPAKVGAMKVDRLTLRTFDAMYAQLERDSVSAHQIRKLHTALSSALTSAMRWGYIDVHPARSAQLPAIPDSKAAAPSIDDLNKLMAEAAKNPLTAVWLRLALATGARRGEELALRWSAVDLKAGTVRIAASLNEDRTVKTTKTNKVRVVALDRATVTALREWKVLQRKTALDLGVGMIRDPWVISNSPDGSVPWRPDGATQRFRRLRKKAGVGPVRLHDMRHAHASMLLRGGTDVVTVAARLGNLATTTHRTYAHVLDGADRAAADAIGAMLG